MSSNPRGAAPAYDEAEKGTLDKVTVFPVEKAPVTYPADEKRDIYPNEKKGEVTVFSAPPAKDPYGAMKATGKKPPPSKVTVAKLWYNTYR